MFLGNSTIRHVDILWNAGNNISKDSIKVLTGSVDTRYITYRLVIKKDGGYINH